MLILGIEQMRSLTIPIGYVTGMRSVEDGETTLD